MGCLFSKTTFNAVGKIHCMKASSPATFDRQPAGTVRGRSVKRRISTGPGAKDRKSEDASCPQFAALVIKSAMPLDIVLACPIAFGQVRLAGVGWQGTRYRTFGEHRMTLDIPAASSSDPVPLDEGSTVRQRAKSAGADIRAILCLRRHHEPQRYRDPEAQGAVHSVLCRGCTLVQSAFFCGILYRFVACCSRSSGEPAICVQPRLGS